MSFLASILAAVGEFFGWRKQRDSLQNAADVKAAAKGKEEAKAKAKTDKAIKNKDTDEIRNQIAE